MADAKQQHYAGIPAEVTPEQAKRLIEQYPTAEAIITERVNKWRYAHDPEYQPEADKPEAPVTARPKRGR